MTELPKGWAVGSLEEITHRITKGTTPTTNGFRFVDKGVSFIKIENIGAGRINRTSISSYISAQADEAQKRSRLLADDLLFSIAGTIGATAIVKPEDLPANTNQALAIITCVAEAVYPPFLRHALQSHIAADTIDKARGGAMNNISLGNLKETAIPLPPLNEQRRIVAKIEAMFERIDKGVESLAVAKTTLGLYRQSLLKSAFEGRLTAAWRAQNPDKLEPPKALLARIQKERETRYKSALDNWQTALSEWRAGGEQGRKPGKPSRPPESDSIETEMLDLPSEWLAVPLSGVAYEAVLGKMLDRDKNRGHPKPYLGNINLRWGSVVVDPNKTIPIEAHEVDRYGLQDGDLIVCEGGEPGRCAVWRGPDNTVFIQKALHRVRFTKSYEPMFAYYFFWFVTAFGRLDQVFTGSTIKHLTGASLAEVPLPICSPAEQAEITRILDARLTAADAMEAEINAALLRAEALRQSILKQAFAGTLVPQDPTDEPAPTLLARIKAERAKVGKTKPRKTAHAG